jgi:GT2 family glycosyltransferase
MPASSSTPAISVVAATHNRAGRLRELLDGLRAQTLGADRFEVVIVDDASSDDTAAVLDDARSRGDLRLQVVSRETSGGPGKARDAGWRAGTGDIVAFTDDDCVPTPRWLEELLAAADGHPRRIVQGRTAPNPAESDRLGPFARWMDVPRQSPYFETCNIAYPRAVLETVGGFDHEFPLPAGEDADLGYRALHAGAKLVFAPDAVVHHAVDHVGPHAILRTTRRAGAEMRAFKQHPELRAQLINGIFYKTSHPLLFQALAALVMSRRHRPALVFALPYLLHLRGRAKLVHGDERHIPFLALYDVLEVGSVLRGAWRTRTPVL